MKLSKILCYVAIGIAGLLAVVFLLDLTTGLFFDRFSIATDVIVLIASGLLLWQSVETLLYDTR